MVDSYFQLLSFSRRCYWNLVSHCNFYRDWILTWRLFHPNQCVDTPLVFRCTIIWENIYRAVSDLYKPLLALIAQVDQDGINRIRYWIWTLLRAKSLFKSIGTNRAINFEKALFWSLQNTRCKQWQSILCQVAPSSIQNFAVSMGFLKHPFGCIRNWRWAALACIPIWFVRPYNTFFLYAFYTVVAAVPSK